MMVRGAPDIVATHLGADGCVAADEVGGMDEHMARPRGDAAHRVDRDVHVRRRCACLIEQIIVGGLLALLALVVLLGCVGVPVGFGGGLRGVAAARLPMGVLGYCGVGPPVRGRRFWIRLAHDRPLMLSPPT
ncbi:hypothetical protein [Nocardia nova]|uniref:hypothetical protein n=1 Tax=Nocardia nova TaxID=37330 RepID=UPI0011B08893|nr:hypothetical protein [Nocardia nova]